MEHAQDPSPKVARAIYSDYTYEPLDENVDSFRLLSISGWRDGRICCSLTQERVSETSYVALSYTWGPCDDEAEISVDGKLLSIRQNLHTFLTSFAARMSENRNHRTSVLDRECCLKLNTCLWIDAICIDQTSVRERNHQVQQMHNIYKSADAVLAWLGAGDPDIALWFGLWPGYKLWSDPDGISWNWSVSKRFLHLEYWSRVWVAQELLLAQTIVVMYGEHVLLWSELWGNEPMNSLTRFSEDSPANFHYDLRRKSYQRSFQDAVMRQVESFKCQDPRDRIYGLLAIVHHGLSFHVDYGETLIELAARASLHFGNGHIHFAQKILTMLVPEAEERWRMLQSSQVDTRPVGIEIKARALILCPYARKCSLCGFHLPAVFARLPPGTNWIICLKRNRSGHLVVFKLHEDYLKVKLLGPLTNKDQYEQASRFLYRTMAEEEELCRSEQERRLQKDVKLKMSELFYDRKRSKAVVDFVNGYNSSVTERHVAQPEVDCVHATRRDPPSICRDVNFLSTRSSLGIVNSDEQ